MEKRHSFLRYITICVMLIFVVNVLADNKVALVIGNEDYSDSNFQALSTPVNDAKEINQKLKKLGYETIPLYNASREEILNALNAFDKKTKKAEVGIFYYSGHATNIGNGHFLVPCKTTFHSATFSAECISVGTIQSMMQKNCKLSLLFLDACRNAIEIQDNSTTKNVITPVNIGSNNKESGPEGQMTCYATENGEKASTGYGPLSPFTQSLSKHLHDSEEFRSVWATIQREVALRSKQNPTCEGSYTNNFYFNPKHISEVSTESDGYQLPTGKIDVDVNLPFSVISYHFSPKYQLGVSFLYHPTSDSRFSYGGIISTSFDVYRGWFSSALVHASASSESNSSTEQTMVTTNVNEGQERYSEVVDPYNEAKKYDANALFLFNLGYNVCNGVMLEAGAGAAYHRDKYYMPNMYQLQKTVVSDTQTGEIVGEPIYKYIKQDISHWYKQNTKWSPAIRLGTKFLIPLDRFKYYCIAFGGGYTYLPINHKFSSWDANVGFLWYF